MLVSTKWLEELLAVTLNIDSLRRTSLHLGLEVEDEKSYAPENIVIGKIKNIAAHPRAQHLSILQIQTNRAIQIVSAARNIKQGDFVLVGPAGAQFNNQTIAERDFDRIKSQGILISEEELGLVEKSTGIITLEKGSAGSLFKNFFDDVVLDISTTPNRPDWLSVVGIARELSTVLGIDFSKTSHFNRYDRIKQINQTGDFKIHIKDVQGCPRYTVRIFDECEVKESPFWMKWRMHCMGMKPVNNIVDITNIIMLLTGQPLHPFDFDLIKNCIIIRKARKEEEFVTLEGSKLRLNKDDLVIADKDGPIALAGIIGAKRAQISNKTRVVALESAYFDQKRIAHTSRRLGLITEASTRFERGADISAVDQTSVMTSELFKTYASTKEHEFISSGKKGKMKNIKFSPSQANRILSLDLNRNQIKTLLKKTYIQTTGEKILCAKIPHFRRDLLIEEDIYEEIARAFGYMNIPETMPKRWGGRVIINKNRINEDLIKNYLVGQGFSEVYNLALTASRRLSNFGFNKFVKIKNPLNERFDALVPTLFIGLLDCVNYNLSKGNSSLKIFETGNILLTQPPYQEKRLGCILGGKRYPDFWNQKDELVDYYDAKGIVESIFDLLHIKGISFKKAVKKGFGQTVKILFSGKELGYLGCIEENLCREPYYYFELALEQMLSLVSDPFYIPPAKFPANTRDLSFLADEKIEVPRIVELINKVGGPVLDKVTLFDYYKGNSIQPGRKNLGFRLYFRAPDRTLTDKEVDSFIEKIEKEVTVRFDAQLRKKE